MILFSLPLVAAALSAEPEMRRTDYVFAHDSECFDEPDFVDGFGDSCDWYSSERECGMAELFRNKHGKTAKDACCMCGGGDRHAHGIDFDYVPGGCVNGHNIVKYEDKSVAECALLCEENLDCVGFEYGVDYGAHSVYKPRDCQLQSSANYHGCDGKELNLDLYVKPGLPPSECAKEGEDCWCSGTVYYGKRYHDVCVGCANADVEIVPDSPADFQHMLKHFEWKTKQVGLPGVASKVECSNEGMGGDPQYGKAKKCFCETFEEVETYEYVSRGCVTANPIAKYNDKSVDECRELCDRNSDCFAFEYGADYDQQGQYWVDMMYMLVKPRDCHLQASADYEHHHCEGAVANLDLYIKPAIQMAGNFPEACRDPWDACFHERDCSGIVMSSNQAFPRCGSNAKCTGLFSCWLDGQEGFPQKPEKCLDLYKSCALDSVCVESIHKMERTLDQVTCAPGDSKCSKLLQCYRIETAEKLTLKTAKHTCDKSQLLKKECTKGCTYDECALACDGNKSCTHFGVSSTGICKTFTSCDVIDETGNDWETYAYTHGTKDDCVWVNHQYDHPGQDTCDCVEPSDPCRTDLGPNGPHCPDAPRCAAYVVEVGNSPSSVAYVEVPLGVLCPKQVSKENWLGGHTYPDVFDIEISQRSDAQGVTISRVDQEKGWGMNLRFTCKRTPFDIFNRRRKESSTSAAAPIPVLAPGLAFHKLTFETDMHTCHKEQKVEKECKEGCTSSYVECAQKCYGDSRCTHFGLSNTGICKTFHSCDVVDETDKVWETYAKVPMFQPIAFETLRHTCHKDQKLEKECKEGCTSSYVECALLCSGDSQCTHFALSHTGICKTFHSCDVVDETDKLWGTYAKIGSGFSIADDERLTWNGDFVCNPQKSFGQAEAEMICAEMGYVKNGMHSYAHAWVAEDWSNPILEFSFSMADLQCPQGASRLSECSYDTNTSGCEQYHGVILRCSNEPRGQRRLLKLEDLKAPAPEAQN